jgi:hypothetical protein
MNNPLPPMYATNDALDKAVTRLEAGMARGFDKVGDDVRDIATITTAHTVQLALDAHRIKDIEEKSLRLEQHRWQLWGWVIGSASAISGVIAWLITHFRP